MMIVMTVMSSIENGTIGKANEEKKMGTDKCYVAIW